jgi:type II secretory pathway component PulJ
MRLLRNDIGLSLAELVIASSLVAVVVTTSYLLLNSFTSMSDSLQAKVAASDSAQLAVDAVTRDLRQAQQNDTDTANGAFSVAQPTYAQFFVDTNHDSKPERVTYYISGNTLFKVVAYPIGTAAPYGFGSTGTPTPVLKSLSPNTTAFVYYSSTVDTATVGTDGYAFQTVSTSDPLNYATKISLVRISLANWVTVGSRTETVTTTELVRIRAVNSRVD